MWQILLDFLLCMIISKNFDMAKYYRVMIDDEVFDEGLTYREACELATELDNSRQYYWKTINVVPMEE